MNVPRLNCITNEEVTVLIHGPISRECGKHYAQGQTVAVIDSVKNFLPGARIIISTWQGAEAENLGADQVIYSIDPGALPYGFNHRPNNVNRQIVVMRAGLKLVKTKYTLKLRSDTVLTSNSLVKNWGKFEARNERLRIFEQRITTAAILTMNPRLCYLEKQFTPFLFHVNDMIQFGLTVDMVKLWDLPLMEQRDFKYFSSQDLRGQRDQIACRRVPEDYVWTTVLSRAGVTVNDSWADFQPQLLSVSELSIINNFCLLDYQDMGVHSLKYPNFEFSHPAGAPFFTHHQWLTLYKEYCDPSIIVPRPKVNYSWRLLLFKWFNVFYHYGNLKKKTRAFRYKIKAFFEASS